MYDLIIIGGSAAGTAAAIYAARRKLNFLMVSDDFGGEVATSGEIMNYPGIAKTDGIELAEKFRDHLKANEVEPRLGIRIQRITKRGEGDFLLEGTKGKAAVSFEARSVIVTTGVHPRHLEVPGEAELAGKGVTYCTTCDGPLFRGKRVTTVGGGNSALESALMLAEIAEQVTVLNLNEEFRGEQVLIDKVLSHPKITVIPQAKTIKIVGDPMVSAIEYEDLPSGQTKTVETQGVFVHIGMIPNSDLLPKEVELNEYKEVLVNLKGETSVPGLFAAGDVTAVPYKQIAIATGQGVAAALAAIEYTNKLAA
jgi:alkyl hydroperoxide reductase subunit AhpF